MAIESLAQFRAHLKAADRSPRTVEIRLRDMAAFVTWFEQTTGKPFEPVAVTPLDVRDYRAYLQTVKGLKPNTVNRALSSLSTFSARIRPWWPPTPAGKCALWPSSPGPHAGYPARNRLPCAVPSPRSCNWQS